MEVSAPREGRFRRWLGAQLGGDEVLGDRALRRGVHAAGAFALIYFVLPVYFFVVLPKWAVLLLAFAAILVLEALRRMRAVRLPTIRPYEEHRTGSYVYYAGALTGALLLFPTPIAATVILGTALIDPLAGELRSARRFSRLYPAVPLVGYWLLAVIGLDRIGTWPLLPSLGLAALAAGLAIAVEWPRVAWIDDDLTMTFLPALALFGIGVTLLGLPG